MNALGELEAVFRGDSRRLVPNTSHLQSRGHKLLMTKFGVLDVLGSLDDLEYQDLLPDSPILALQGMNVHVLSLKRLIEVKQKAGREKDLAELPLLRATLLRAQRPR